MKKIMVVSIIVLCLVMLVPFVSAADNETVMIETNLTESNDYYFDVNASSEGNGTAESPYSNFTDELIEDNSVIHLASGEYRLEKSRSFSNVTFNGNGSQNTVLDGNGCTLTVTGLVTFNNITLTNLNIVNRNTLKAYNTVFESMVSSRIDNYGATYGGAIYASTNKNIYLDNCTFLNNTAGYGGALYINGGKIMINNSLFVNNFAWNFGGTIVANSKTKLYIYNSRFINARSSNDAGGAIYSISSAITASNVSFINCSSTFGAAVTALSSDLTLSDIYALNNTARYEGGAIYQMYGTINLTSSRFISNTARNGAGLFIDNVTSIDLSLNEFTQNNALSYGGAVYLLYDYEINLTDSNFTGNCAEYYNDTYRTGNINMNFGNGDYAMYVCNPDYDGELPGHYDLRELGMLAPVEDQENGGNCWAFSALASLESCIIKASGEVWDFSEENMKNLMALFSDYGRSAYYPNEGGFRNMAVGYLVSWLGPVTETADPYNDRNHLSPVLDSVLHVQNVLFLKRSNYTDNDAIKRAIMNYGAVVTSMYYSSSYIRMYSGNIPFYYYSGKESPNHSVAIVGWDDSLTINGRTGAWIVRNSWGPNWADHGYFYVSYQDSVFAMPGTYTSYTFILNDTQHFDKNYQHEVAGVTDYFYVNQDTVWYKSAFNATDNEFLAGVSTYFEKDTDWELSVYVNSKLQLVQSGFSAVGYYTINLNYPVPLVNGDLFEILFKITVDGDVGFPISESISLTKVTYGPGMSFVSINGQDFFDLYDLVHDYPDHYYLTQVACIKAFTQFFTHESMISDFSVVFDSFDLFNVTVSLVDENGNPVGNGNVTFTVNGETFTVNVENGTAILKVPLPLGANDIQWEFISLNYYPCGGVEIYEVLPVELGMEISVVQDFNNAYINFTTSRPINECLVVNINGEDRTIELMDGRAHINLTGLEYGEYNVSAVVDSEFFNCSNSTRFFVDVKKTYIRADDLTTFYRSGESFIIYLFDEFDGPVSNAQIRFTLDNVTYFNSTDLEGRLSVSVDLVCGNYPIDICYDGDGSHISSQYSSNIIINPSATSLDISVVYDSFNLFNITVVVLDQLNNTLTGGEVTFNVNGEEYVITDGFAILAPLNVGMNNISASFNQANYIDSYQNIAFEVQPIKLDMNITVVQDFNNAYLNFTVSQKINGTLIVYDNGANWTVNVTGGIAHLNLTGLDYGEHDISAIVSSEFYNCSNSTRFFVDVKKTFIEADDLTTFYGSGESFIIYLFDEFDEPISNAQIRFTLDNVTYFNSTDLEGKISVPLDLVCGDYSVDICYDGDGSHIKSQYSANIIIVPSATSLDISVVYDSFNLFNITVVVLNQLNNTLTDGEVTFNVNGAIYVLTDGFSLQTPLVVGMNDISVSFKRANYQDSYQNITFEVQPIKLDMNITVAQDFNNAYLNFTVSQKINGTLIVCDNGANWTVNVEEGIAHLELTYLGYGEHNITAYVGSDTYGCRNSTSFFVNVKRTMLRATDLKCTYSDSMVYSARLVDQFAEPVVGREVWFKIDGKEYRNITDENGTVMIRFDLEPSTYDITIGFAGDDLYDAAITAMRQISIKPSVYLPQSDTYALNSNYEFSLLDKYGNPLNDTSVTITVNSKEYVVRSDENGTFTFKIPFNSGSFNVTVINPDTSEVQSQNIKVVKRITENKAMTFYYGNKPTYKIRVCDDNGNYVSGLKVKVVVGKKSYKLSTDKNGYASLKLNLASGKYTITAEYNGYKVSNKITVKPTLITKDKKAKKAKTVKFTAKLLDKKGKVLKGKKITFKIKGKIYKAKTNKKGIATIKIKNLKVGTHKIITKYGKLKTTNKITIKK